MDSSKNNIISTPLAILLGSVVISVAILISGGIIKLKGLEGTKPLETIASPLPQASTLPTQPEEDSGPVKVSLDDDSTLGDKNAALTMVEFSDYECPFCKRYFDQTFPQIKKDYVDSGKLKIIFRDLPLSFHDPMATTEAIAANCAKEQEGDSVYFKFHDLIFKNTTSNGNGLSKDDLYKFAADLNLNSANFKICLDTEKYKDEVEKDLADATNYGANGTPTFFIGKSTSSGTIEGTKLIGAQPYSSFKSVIDSLLK